jgi:hypothetical protein
MLLAVPAQAQKTGTVEVGGFARYNDFDNSLPFNNTIGVGGRVAVWVLPRLAIEGDYSTTSANQLSGSKVKFTPLHAMVVYNVPVDARSEIVVGAGYVRNKYKDGYDATDNGVAGLVGLRYRFHPMVAVRLDANEDFVPSPANKSQFASFNGNLGVQVGVSVLLNWSAAAK